MAVGFGIYLFIIYTEPGFAVDFDILSYQGDLNIHADNTAIFKETITYRFGDDYNGQLVGLGKAGKMPEGFDIDPDPTVQVSKNGRIVQNVFLLYYGGRGRLQGKNLQCWICRRYCSGNGYLETNKPSLLI